LAGEATHGKSLTGRVANPRPVATIKAGRVTMGSC